MSMCRGNGEGRVGSSGKRSEIQDSLGPMWFPRHFVSGGIMGRLRVPVVLSLWAVSRVVWKFFRVASGLPPDSTRSSSPCSYATVSA